MKKLQLFALLSIMLAAVACSSDHVDEPQIPYDKAYSRALSTGLENTTYTLCELTYYDKSSLTNNKWEYFDYREWCGTSNIAPNTITIQGGKLYTEYKLFSLSSGPSLIGNVWSAYKYSTGNKQTLYLAREFEINDEDNTLEIAGHGTFTVLGVNQDGFEMETVYEYWGGKSGNGGHQKEVSRYRVAEHKTIENVLAFESEKDLVKSVIELAREKFGNIVDLNQIYYPNVIFDDYNAHVINLDYVAKYYGVD